LSDDRPKITIYDVARRAGVAISTVSRVLNESPDVSMETRRRVNTAIEALNFRPDRRARQLAQQGAPTLAIAMPTLTTPFHASLLKGIRLHLRERELDLLFCDLGSRERHRALIHFLHRGAVSGLLLVGLKVTEDIASEFKSMGAAVAILGYQHEDFDSYWWDDIEGARRAVAHLTSMGHRRIGMIRSASESRTQIRRIDGYRSALQAAGLPFDETLVAAGTTDKHAGYSEESGYEAMGTLMALNEPVTAVFCASDAQAMGAWLALRESGIRVPEDVAIVGYDDVKTSRYVGLSSMDQAMQQVGELAAIRLLKRMDVELDDPPSSFCHTPELRIRSSSAFQRG
jgi:LacI family transcriptional regulator